MSDAAQDRAKELSQWFTPPDLARRIVAWSGVSRGSRVLEPSCGTGAFLAPLVESGANVHGVEIDAYLFEELTHAGYSVTNDNFLSLTPDDLGTFDLVVTNPPYEGGADLAHVLHALKFAPRVVALLKVSFLSGQKRGRELWRHNTLSRLAILSGRPEFDGPGDHGAKSDYAVFEIRRGREDVLAPTVVGWW